MTTYDGACFCGEVQYEVMGEPMFVQNCHCNKCREVASKSQDPKDKVGYSSTAAYLSNHFKVVKGEDQLEALPRNNAYLYLCQHCGSLVYGVAKDPKQREGMGLNFNTLKIPSPTPESFKPIRHVYYADRTITVEDDLPKYVDMPKALGGTDDLCELKDPRNKL